ncbi:MAG: phospho-N-acetylmuramoyl-pentapeptide-transferase [Planctomycetes bacterium]|nr:phospho-N-acetylmuramoyl-pentapeptide-transferase [Planctomycetota bacterium]
MIYNIFEAYFRDHGLILRITAAAVTSFILVIMMGPGVIRFLIRKKIGDRPEFDRADLNQLTRDKRNTPTMGGLMIVLAIFASTVLFANLRITYVGMGLLVLVWLGVLGGVDDWIKLKYAANVGSRDGLKTWEKIIFQIALAVLVAINMYSYGSQSWIQVAPQRWVNPAHSLYLPFTSDPIALSLLAYVIISVLTMVGSSNAVNLTDGMDGLASGCVGIAAAVLLLFSWIVGVEEWANVFKLPKVAGSAEMTIMCSAMLGAVLGFLWFNASPAQVFMGDTGSLPLGGLIGYIAVVTRQELLLLIVGGVFVMEAGSVLLQVGYFKMTKPKGGGQGRRLFRCAPIHHHFHLGGWAETKVVARFWILGLIFAALALATLKLR